MPETTEALLQRFATAWNRHDIEGLLALVTEDCVFETVAGATANGAIVTGKAALRTAFPAAWTT